MSDFIFLISPIDELSSMVKEDFKQITLNNGIRFLHLHTESSISHLAIIIKTGSRNELQTEHGLAHLIEHCFFKGTKNKNNLEIINSLDNVGGELNAYTTKEETCLHASFATKYFNIAADLLTDITFNSTFPQKEMDKEINVIIDEINSYDDSPSESIFDEFEEHFYKGNRLAHKILGDKKTIVNFKTKHLKQFVKNNYSNGNIVFCSAGNHNINSLAKQLNDLLSDTNVFDGGSKNDLIKSSDSFQISKTKPIQQSHCIIGFPTFSLHNKKKYELALLNNIFGGPAMNSLLNLEIREKKGLTYQIDSSLQSYTDTGNMAIYFGCEKKHVALTQELIFKQINSLKKKKLSELSLSNFKKQFEGHFLLANESNFNQMLAMGRSLLYFNKVEQASEIIRNITKISAKELCDLANEIFEENKYSTLTYTPK